MGLNEIIHEKCRAQGLAPSKHPINVPLREKQRGLEGEPGGEVSEEHRTKLQRQEAGTPGQSTGLKTQAEEKPNPTQQINQK